MEGTMQVDGIHPNGPDSLDKLSGKRKAEPKAGGKSFADALGKARSGAQPPAAPPQAVPPTGGDQPPPMDNHIDTVRFRLQSGYYNNSKIDDAISDKLSGFFDDVA